MNLEWNPEKIDVIGGLKRVDEEMRANIGLVHRPTSFQEMLHWDVQQLHLLGYSPEQVIAYVKSATEIYQRTTKEASDELHPKNTVPHQDPGT